MELLKIIIAMAGLVAGSSFYTPTPEMGGFTVSDGYRGVYYSAAAYCTREQILKWDCGGPCDYHPQFKVLSVTSYELYAESNQVFTGYSEVDKQFVISFEGTHNPVQLVEEGINSTQVDAQFYQGQKTYKIQQYFWDAYSGLRADIMQEITPYLSSDISIFVTGHSLGGALATVCAFDLAISGKIDKSRITKYTFGEPRVGDPVFANDFD